MIYSWHRDTLARFGVKVIIPPAGEQITLEQAKRHCRIDDDSGSPPSTIEDDDIRDMIVAAREYCEGYSGRSLAPQTLEIAVDAWPRTGVVSCAPCLPSSYEYWALPLPQGPVTAVVSVTNGGTAYTDYVFANYMQPARLLPLAGGTWPTMTPSAEAIKVRYIAGYDLPDDSPTLNPLPKIYKSAMLLVLGTLYENREDTALLTSGSLELLPMGARALMDLAPGGPLRLGMA